MATLNVRNRPDALYRKLQTHATRQRRSVAQEVAQIFSDLLESPKPLSIHFGPWRGCARRPTFPPDSLHVVSALTTGCKTLLTNDWDFESPGIANPSAFFVRR